jgi:ABC-type Co2+ transport system permease subunit
LAIALSVVASVYFALLPGEVSDVAGVANPLGIESLRPIGRVMDVVLTVLFLVAVLCSVASLMVRFRRSRGEERQQMKWLTYAAAAMFAVLLIVMPLPDDATWYPVVDSLTSLVFGGMPVAVGIAVLRYRLYEIDLLINRTLVYGALTALLVTVYVGGVVLLQGAFRALTGQESQLAIVASTLAVAALFNPLRRRIQAFIDRYFYRRKYDARKTLEAYSAKLRDETNLEALNTELVGVVRETMQPAHVSLWLRPNTLHHGERAH